MNKGIDISEHNGTIDFEKVKNSGIDFVIIRIGWLGNRENHTLDKKFNEYYEKAKQVGLKIGFYVYSYCKRVETLRNGINWLIDKIEGKTPDLPIFLDLEDSSIIECGKENLTEQAIQFCTILQNLGYKSGIYANKDWFLNKLDINKLLDYKIWLAEWNGKENHTLGFKVDLWQYSSDGQINGINGRVDLNKCLCKCEESNNNQETTNNINGVDEEVKVYQNGSTVEIVYSDVNCTNKIGSLNKYEQCDCLGLFQNRAIVRYKIDNSNNYKVGFVKYLGGVK